MADLHIYRDVLELYKKGCSGVQCYLVEHCLVFTCNLSLKPAVFDVSLSVLLD